MTLSKDDLEKKYQNMSNENLATELKVSIPTLLKIIDNAGIDRKGSGNPFNKEKINVIKNS